MITTLYTKVKISQELNKWLGKNREEQGVEMARIGTSLAV
jgi:hypothetical protein